MFTATACGPVRTTLSFPAVTAIVGGHEHLLDDWFQRRRGDERRIVRLGRRRERRQHLHRVARDVDDFLVFGKVRTDREVLILRELVQRQQVVAGGMHRVAADRLQVADVVVHVDAIDDVVGRAFDRLVDVPLHDLAVEKQRRERVAAIVERGVQRPETDLGSATILSVCASMIVTVGDSLPGGDGVAAVRRHIDAVGFLGTGISVSTPGSVSGSRIGTPFALAAPGGDGLLGRGMSMAATASRSY
jgi:hypothetical protein